LDYGILEKSSSLEVISYDGGWSDLGDWDAVAQFLQGDGTHKMGGEVRLQSIESYDCIVQTSKELDVALIGVSDLTIVFGTEGLLIMRNGEGQSLRKVKSTTK
jgi:mannose-1-phosphate guanylyltransferase